MVRVLSYGEVMSSDCFTDDNCRLQSKSKAMGHQAEGFFLTLCFRLTQNHEHYTNISTVHRNTNKQD